MALKETGERGRPHRAHAKTWSTHRDRGTRSAGPARTAFCASKASNRPIAFASAVVASSRLLAGTLSTSLDSCRQARSNCDRSRATLGSMGRRGGSQHGYRAAAPAPHEHPEPATRIRYIVPSKDWRARVPRRADHARNTVRRPVRAPPCIEAHHPHQNSRRMASQQPRSLIVLHRNFSGARVDQKRRLRLIFKDIVRQYDLRRSFIDRNAIPYMRRRGPVV